MKIWEINSGHKTLHITVEDRLNQEVDQLLDNIFYAKEIKQKWKPLTVVYEKDKGKYIDFPSFSPGVLVLSERAVSTLEPLIGNLVEILPLQDDKYNFYFCNVINVLDCVDKTNSVPIIESNKIFSYENMYLHEEMIMGSEKRHIFKVPELVGSRIYVSDEFRNAVLEAGLKILSFDLVWDSEFTKEDEIAMKQRYENYLVELEQNKGPEMSWDEAMKLLDEGKAVASAHWKMQKNANKELLVGRLTYNLDYELAELIYIPPILLDSKWHEVERSE
ncbi:imm11 family protein [Paenibacillus enshidis]|uniref:Imm11 family protein n=1 Tax=Paenibacillus enshidis TaxID=1458439 RepID=A0ABV5AYY5_9BACL